MADDSTTALPTNEGRDKRYPVGVIAGVSFVAVVVAALLIFSGRNSAPTRQAISGDSSGTAVAYASQLAFSGLHLSAEENFLGQQVVYLDGTLTNTGAKIIRQLRVRLVFRDVMNQIVLREEHDAFAPSAAIAPGSAKAFQIRFDAVPDSWSRQVPEIQIVSLRAE